MGRPDRLTICAIGDGGLMMSLGDLDTAVRAKVPLLILVLDDGGDRGRDALPAHARPARRRLALPTPDLVGVARALGLDAMAVTTLDDLDEVAKRAADLTPTLLVHIPVNRDVRAGWLEEAFARAVH